MLHYKAPTGKIYGIATEADVHMLPAGSVAMTDAEVTAARTAATTLTPEQSAAQIRAQRNALMTQCDWTQLPDVNPTTAALWVAYRQALRNVTTQPTFPASVTWPTIP